MIKKQASWGDSYCKENESKTWIKINSKFQYKKFSMHIASYILLLYSRNNRLNKFEFVLFGFKKELT